ncbi:carbohydrate-binding module family 24 protein [Daldinia bambusicola]|nr:carbohydrate-binding module family 24 protein [Daldinia bambusicola]
MLPDMRSVTAIFVWGASLGLAAVDLEGNPIVSPVTEDDPSPISNSETYYPDQHNCPLPCADYSNIHSWTPYFSVDRLQRCEEPMLLQFSISQLLDDPSSTVLIRSCTLGPVSAVSNITAQSATGTQIENPKKDIELLDASLDIASACTVTGTEIRSNLKLLSSRKNSKEDPNEALSLLEGMQDFFDHGDNCDENFLFAYYKQTVAGVYTGPGLTKPTVGSVLKTLAAHLRSGSSIPDRVVAQLCDKERHTEKIFGISIDTTGDLPAVQKTVLNWSEGNCAEDKGSGAVLDLLDVSVFDIAEESMVNDNGILGRRNLFEKRAVCRHIKVVSGDSCASLVKKCGITAAEFTKYNPKANLCATLMPGDYVCCSAGDPYKEPKPTPPKPGKDGICATHLIANGDTCAALAKKYGLTVANIEKFNQGKTWAWTACKDMLLGYNMCLSDGLAPLPPPQQGTECGPLVPGTKRPTNKSISLADLNPCPLKACCSNWGFCGPFPAHCDIHAPKGGGPGTKLPGFQSTCVSNCGNAIKKNSGPPANFQRIGYYESWNLGRDCLWLKAKHANTDGSYTHIHWGFAEIDSKTWKPVIKDPNKQWADFKALDDVKRIVSFGGWAYSTEPATYNIIRQAIIDKPETFSTNVADFVNNQGLDGVDFDWEYPGAPDILVNGQPIGKKGDGAAYLKFLTTLKNKLGKKSVSIAAPASYWYLKAFPIDKIAAKIDYIVYMTYDLHGQWDYGNVNAFDSCPSGKCIRSHVNLTETRNALSIITKAGAANNKIFVGESSYGRSFHMAKDGCWGPTCQFTGSRNKSDAKPGRCTKTAGYIANAEINEIIAHEVSAKLLHDAGSNTDVVLYKGDYISYETPTTKNTRRALWKGLNFAGSIDWAVDLQAFTKDDMDAPPGNGAPGKQGCVGGIDSTVNTGDLCAFACAFDFCPSSLCTCKVRGTIKALPAENKGVGDIIAWDDLDVDTNRLCKFACKYNYCPDEICTRPVVDEDENGLVTVGDPNNPDAYDYEEARRQNAMNCVIFQDPKYRDASTQQCYATCKPTLDQAKQDGRTANYGCVGDYPLDKPIPWEKVPGSPYVVAPAKCSCDNWLVNELANEVIDAMPIIAQIGCYILMSSLKFVLDVGSDFLTGGAGKALDAGLDMATTAAQMASYVYPEEEDPEGAFSWWLSPCGGTDLVPDDIKKIFGILNQVADGISSFKAPKNIPKGSGRKGDGANPTDRAKPKAGTGLGPNGTGGVTKKKKCKIPKDKDTIRIGAAQNTIRKQSCVNDQTQKEDMVITSVIYAAAAPANQIIRNCDKAWSQACFHYSSAIRVNPSWKTITCPQDAASTAHRLDGKATSTWSAQHNGKGWQDGQYRREKNCNKDEYPPAYLLQPNDPAFVNGGKNAQGQLVRWLPWDENQKAGQTWKGICFIPPVEALSNQAFENGVKADTNRRLVVQPGIVQTMATVTVNQRPEFSFGTWGHAKQPPKDDGLRDNPCWPSGAAKNDPGFVLLTYDPWYKGNPPPYDYKKPVP